MKTVIFHDFFIDIGGGGKVVNILSKYLKAPIVTCFYDKSNLSTIQNTKIFHDNSFFNKLKSIRELKLIRTIYFFNHKLKKLKNFFNENFDSAIFSGFYSIYFARFLEIYKIYYIQAEPLSYIFERENYKSLITYKYIYELFLKKLERDSIFSFDKTIANSNYIKKVYEEEFGIKVNKIIYPPVDTSKFYYREPEDYFLLVSRLYPYKRVDVVAKVFTKIPSKKLVIVGSGPLASYIRRLSQRYKNIKYLGKVSEKKLIELYARCNAVIYISEKEHFGLVPLEANSAGKPAIVANEGGLTEGIIPFKTGLILDPPYESNLKEVIENFDKYHFSKIDCIKNAKRFDKKVFLKNFLRELKN